MVELRKSYKYFVHCIFGQQILLIINAKKNKQQLQDKTLKNLKLSVIKQSIT